MTKEKLIIIPEKIIPASEKTVNITYCDICGEEYYAKCYMCGRDICSSHTIVQFQNCSSDYPDYFCPICIEEIESYYKELRESEDKYNAERDIIAEKYKNISLSKKGF